MLPALVRATRNGNKVILNKGELVKDIQTNTETLKELEAFFSGEIRERLEEELPAQFVAHESEEGLNTNL